MTLSVRRKISRKKDYALGRQAARRNRPKHIPVHEARKEAALFARLSFEAALRGAAVR